MATANAIAEVNTNDVERDQFGRDEAERTIVLASEDAEAINHEAEAGGHDTYDDALHYVITRGLAEIKRTRDAQAANKAKTVLKAKVDTWKKLLELNPALVADPNIVGKMMTELGMLKQASTK